MKKTENVNFYENDVGGKATTGWRKFFGTLIVAEWLKAI